MDFLTALHVSASGLAAERTRVNITATNLANAESTRGPDGKPYRRRDPIFETQTFEGELQGVRVAGVQEDQGPGKRVYSPGHPDADANGFVTFPDVNPIHEVVNLMQAQKSYDANATAVDTLKGMAARALEIAR
ncbi:MAG: flagellar basal body rod protein FlgC [Myxococcaceae bacterium]|nr:flagellar basal body rod protein FlgC [Myxococcaceae bacterium]